MQSALTSSCRMAPRASEESFILLFLKHVIGNEFGFDREGISVRLSPTEGSRFSATDFDFTASVEWALSLKIENAALKLLRHHLFIVKSPVTKSATAGFPTTIVRLPCIT